MQNNKKSTEFAEKTSVKLHKGRAFCLQSLFPIAGFVAWPADACVCVWPYSKQYH